MKITPWIVHVLGSLITAYMTQHVVLVSAEHFGEFSAAFCDVIAGLACGRPLMATKCPSLDCNRDGDPNRNNRKESEKKNNRPKSEEKSRRNKKDDNSKEKKFRNKDDQVEACCRAQGVRKDCMDLCAYKMPPKVGCRTECFDELKKTLYCAANEQDNRECCEKKNSIFKDKKCVRFCNGKEKDDFGPMPPLNDVFGDLNKAISYRECIKGFGDLMECHKDNSPDEDLTREKNWGSREKVDPSVESVLKSVQKC